MEKKIFFGNFLFYIYWTILLVGKGWGLSSLDKIYVNMLYVAIIFAILKMLITNWNKNELLKVVLLNILGVIIFIFTHDAAALLLTITIASIKNIRVDKVMFYSLIVRLILFFTKISLALTGVIDKQKIIRYNLGSIHTVRYSLGYGQPNVTQAMLFIIIALIILNYKDKIKTWHYLILGVFNYWLYTYTNSRTGFLVTLLLIILSWSLSRKWNNYVKNIIIFFSDKCYTIGAIISLVICFSFSKISFLHSVNSLNTLTGRISTAIFVINSHGFPIFGFPDILTDWGYIDILYEKGIIFFVLALISMKKILKYLKNKNDIYLISIFVSISIYLFGESYFASILVNNFLLYLGVLLYGDTILNSSRRSG